MPRLAPLALALVLLLLPGTCLGDDGSASPPPTDKWVFPFDTYYRWNDVEARICRHDAGKHLIALLYRKVPGRGDYGMAVFSSIEALHFGEYPRPEDLGAPLDAIRAGGHVGWRPLTPDLAVDLLIGKDRRDTSDRFNGEGLGRNGLLHSGPWTGASLGPFLSHAFYNPYRMCPAAGERTRPCLYLKRSADSPGEAVVVDYCEKADRFMSSRWKDGSSRERGSQEWDLGVILVTALTSDAPGVPLCGDMPGRIRDEAPTPPKKAAPAGGLKLTSTHRCSDGTHHTSREALAACEERFRAAKEQERLAQEKARQEKQQTQAEKKQRTEQRRLEQRAEEDRICADLIAKTGSPCHIPCRHRPEFALCGSVSQ